MVKVYIVFPIIKVLLSGFSTIYYLNELDVQLAQP